MKKATYTVVFNNGDFKNFRTAEAVREWKCKENTWKQISKKGGIHTILLDDGSENVKTVYYEFFTMFAPQI